MDYDSDEEKSNKEVDYYAFLNVSKEVNRISCDLT